MVLPGRGPSTGDKTKVYKLQLSDARGLAATLSPRSLSKDRAHCFSEGLADITTFPKAKGLWDVTEGSMMLDV